MHKELSKLRIGYVPYSKNLHQPGDRRRFPYYAFKRQIKFEIADPNESYDLVILSSRADISVWSRYCKGKLVYDLIDSYLAIPRSDFKGQLRGLFKFLSRQSRFLQMDYWHAIENMCSRADAVVCSTQEQRSDIMTFCSNVHIILDAHMGVARTVKEDYQSGSAFRMVWEGLPQNLGSLELLVPIINQLRRRYQIEIHVITDRKYFRYLGNRVLSDSVKFVQKIFPDVIFHEWQETTVAEIICACDLAVIPIPLTNKFALGKPENKLLLFWRMGVPVITSSTPAYLRAMESAGIDLVAKDETEWLVKIEELIVNKELRKQAGKLGKLYTDREFSENILLAKWDSVFQSLGFSC